MTIAIVLGMGVMAFAQDVYEERGLFGMGKESTIYSDRSEGDALILPDHGQSDDQDADAPLGTGIALLTTLGAAYLVGKRRKED